MKASASRCYNEGTKAADADRERSNLRGLTWGAKKHRSAKILVELQALRGVYGKMFCGSASVPMLSRAAALRHQALCSTDEQLPRNAHRAAALNSQGREVTRLLAVQSIAQSRVAMGKRAAAGMSAER